MFSKAKSALRIVRNEGSKELINVLRKNIVRARWNRLNRRFDIRYGVETSGSLETVELDIASDNRTHGVRYEATPVKTVHRVLAQIPTNLSSYTFVDYGSGKGKALLLASHHPFRKIIGVEYAKDLHDVAERNLRSYRATGRKCLDITSVHGDAAQFPIPEGPVIFYFFQPFVLDVMQAVINKLHTSFMGD